MRPRRIAVVLVSLTLALAGVACLQDFDTFEGTPAVQETPDAVAQPDPVDASTDTGIAEDASAHADAGPCTSAPQTCLTQRTTCTKTCDATNDTCEKNCKGGGAATCKEACKAERSKCRDTCNAVCSTCGGACTIGCT